MPDLDVSPDFVREMVAADLAARAGYFDQSHFIRDCVALAGTSPRALHAERRRQVIENRAMSVLSNPA